LNVAAASHRKQSGLKSWLPATWTRQSAVGWLFNDAACRPSPLICPTGKFCKFVSSPLRKNIPLRREVETVLLIRPSRSSEGRFAIVTNAERDAMDAKVLLTNGTQADGEVVWS